jgi:hypothetical protein
MMGFREALPSDTQRHHTGCLSVHSFTQTVSRANTKTFQQGAVPPHFPRNFIEFLSTTFLGKWIGRDGTNLWPPRSPDLIRLDFLGGGYVKYYVCMDKIRDVNHFKARIRDAAEQVT